MKVKKLIGKTINGFTILDSYGVVYPSGSKGRKVKIKCENCGREFERTSGVDFDHIKCKCKCVDYMRPKKKYIYVTYNCETLNLSKFCKKYGLNERTTRDYIKKGLPINEIVTGEFSCVCKLCGETFKSSKPSKMYCCSTHQNRAGHGKWEYKQPHYAKCIVCGKQFETLIDNARTCSQKCRSWHDRIARNSRYKELKAQGYFDHSVTLNNVYDAFKGICACCGEKLSFDCSHISDKYPSIDHIIPLSKGGTHTWDNVQLLCRKCNYEKGNKTMEVLSNGVHI